MRIAKASEEDVVITGDFLRACEAFWDNRNIFSMRRQETEWVTWEDDDPDKMLILDIRQHIANDMDVDPEQVDGRIVVYEYLKQKYKKADNRWGRVIMAAEVLIDNCCDPLEEHLQFYPGFELFHVAPEQ